MTLPSAFNVFRAIEQSLSYLNRRGRRLICRACLKHSCEITMLVTLVAVGDGRAQSSPPASQAGPGVASTSYENAKGLNLSPQKLPYPAARVTARAFGDFFQRGSNDLFVATTNFDPAFAPAQSAAGRFEFWRRQADNRFVRDTSLLRSDIGCKYPTKAIVADFNYDGRPDLFVACRGLGPTAFVGERSAVLLSQPDGTYETTFLDFDGAFVSAAAADLTGSGHIDIVAIDANTTTYSAETNSFADGFPIDSTTTAMILVNDGKGHFSADASSMPRFITDFTDVEALDLNGDGRPDLVLLGADGGYGQPSIALLNDGSGSFANVRPVVLPAARMANPAPQDMVFVDGALYLSRTDGSARPRRMIQRIGWPSLQSTVVYEGDASDSLGTTGWLLPVKRDGWMQLNSDCMPDRQGLELR